MLCPSLKLQKRGVRETPSPGLYLCRKCPWRPVTPLPGLRSPRPLAEPRCESPVLSEPWKHSCRSHWNSVPNGASGEGRRALHHTT